MATPMPTPNHIIIWLDQHIGLVGSNTRLKTSVAKHVDPEEPLPEPILDKDIENLAKLNSDMDQSFENIPKNLKTFSDKDECLTCIGESLNSNKKIFFITSGSMGKKIAPDIIEKKYKSLETIYVFCGDPKNHVEWMQDCFEEDVSCCTFTFPTYLLARILRDVAEYFITQGDAELKLSEQLAYSAIKYFQWAKLLIERANNCDKTNILDRLEQVERRIEHTENLQRDNNDVEESKESFK
jgi:hypothetical protein